MQSSYETDTDLLKTCIKMSMQIVPFNQSAFYERCLALAVKVS